MNGPQTAWALKKGINSMPEATVYKSTGSWYDLKDDDQTEWKARIKGIFKIGGLTSTNPLAVGDRVVMDVEDDANKIAMISEILPRTNYISRQSPSHRKQHHIIASNLDQTLLVASFKNPRTSLGFIDRFLVAAEAYHVPAILVLNKCDGWGEKEDAQYKQAVDMYEPLGYQVLKISALTGQGIEPLTQLLQHKTTLLSGHSGVGKSSLLNTLFPNMELRTGAVSDWSGKGLHTTTFAQMFDLPNNAGRVIDTPGVKEFGIVDITKEDLSHYFPEMKALITQCKFNNCQHVNEPSCAVKDGIASGLVTEERYKSYLHILFSLVENTWE